MNLRKSSINRIAKVVRKNELDNRYPVGHQLDIPDDNYRWFIAKITSISGSQHYFTKQILINNTSNIANDFQDDTNFPSGLWALNLSNSVVNVGNIVRIEPVFNQTQVLYTISSGSQGKDGALTFGRTTNNPWTAGSSTITMFVVDIAGNPLSSPVQTIQMDTSQWPILPGITIPQYTMMQIQQVGSIWYLVGGTPQLIVSDIYWSEIGAYLYMKKRLQGATWCSQDSNDIIILQGVQWQTGQPT